MEVRTISEEFDQNSKMKIVFAPFGTDNPYQYKLIDSLKSLGIEVIPAKSGTIAFFLSKAFRSADIVHFHWYEYYGSSRNLLVSIFKTIVFLCGLKIWKSKKKYVWTVHNFVGHDRKYGRLSNWFARRFVSLMDGFSAHNQYTKEKLETAYRIPPELIFDIPHGNYANLYPSFTGNLDQIKKEIPGYKNSYFTFAFIGHIRPYKGVMDIIEAFKKLTLPNKQLLICGQVKFSEDARALEETVAGFEDIILKIGYIAENKMEAYLRLSDVMIYPYKAIVTSGSLLLGMSYRKLCLVTEVGSMSEFIASQFRFNSNEQLTQKMWQVMQMSPEEIRGEGDRNYDRIKHDTWDRMAQKTVDMYKVVAARHN